MLKLVTATFHSLNEAIKPLKLEDELLFPIVKVLATVSLIINPSSLVAATAALFKYGVTVVVVVLDV